MTSSTLAIQNGNAGNLAVVHDRGELTKEDLETLRATVLKGASDAQLRLYARTCRSRGLDPFAKEIHGWAGRDGSVEIVVGIDGLRQLAESSGEYRGQGGPWYCGTDKEWTEVWLGPGKPLAAKVCVKREGMEPVCNVALLTECERNTPVWRTQLSTMLAIRAEAQAIRRLFPRQTTGLYAEGELPDPEEDETPATPSRSTTAPTATHRATPAPAEVVDAETGEIQGFNPDTATQKQITDEITRLRSLLGWTEPELRDFAANNRISGRSRDGQLQMVAALTDLLDNEYADDDDEDGEPEQGQLIDAETRSIERNVTWD